MRNPMWPVRAIAAALLLLFGRSLAAEVTLVEDVFGNRPASNDLGLMSDGVHTWYEREGSASSIRSVAASGAFPGSMYVGQGDMGAAVANFMVADGIIRFRNHWLQPLDNGGWSNIGGLTYRAASLANATDIWSADAYHLAFFPPNSANNRPQRIVLSYGRYDVGIKLADVTIGTNWVARNFEVHVAGDSHKVYVDGALKIDVTNTNRLAAGYVGFSHYSLGAHWSLFRVSYVPPAGTVIHVR